MEGRQLESAQLEQRYTRFSALVHFLDPSKNEEERPINLDLKPYANVLRVLEGTNELTLESLSELLRNSPKAIRIFELILQNSKFTTAQRAFLLFDLQRLNSAHPDDALGYILEVLCEDEMIRSRFRKKGLVDLMSAPNLDQLGDERKRSFLAEAKMVMAGLCEGKSNVLLYNRMKVSEAARKRAASYLIHNRALPNVLTGIRPTKFIENKRIPVDSKTAHGEYASGLLEGMLVRGGFRYRGDGTLRIPRADSSQQLLDEPSDVLFYCKKTEVESSSSPGASISSELTTAKGKTGKQFDFVLLLGSTPKVVIETNIYTTSGSKIGINEKEYLALHRHMAEAENGLRFIWVTDGSYWLTSSGKKSFFKLASSFGQDLMNLALFEEELGSVKSAMSSAERE